MNDLIKAVILGVVEGLAEFLPISSTGHLILVNQFVAFSKDFTNMFDYVIQLGAILSVVIYFWHKLNPFSRKKTAVERNQTFDLWKKTIVGVIPAVFIGKLFQESVENYLFNPITVSIALVVGGILLIYIENRSKTAKIASMEQLSYRTAFTIGLIQCAALIPGTSRSAATIIGAMLLGASRVVATEFSFFLAIPSLTGATFYYLLKTGFSMTGPEIGVLAVGFTVSFLVAWLVIAAFMRFIQRHDLKPFAYYRIILGGLILLYFSLLH
jgi:undecaprenyl-diphosphatase